MSRVKTKNKTHVLVRAKERLGLEKSNAQAMIRNAHRLGVDVNNLPPGPIKEFLLKKQAYKNKRIKLYKNIVFIFSRNSDGCNTLYKLNDDVIEAQKKFDQEGAEQHEGDQTKIL